MPDNAPTDRPNTDDGAMTDPDSDTAPDSQAPGDGSEDNAAANGPTGGQNDSQTDAGSGARNLPQTAGQIRPVAARASSSEAPAPPTWSPAIRRRRTAAQAAPPPARRRVNTKGIQPLLWQKAGCLLRFFCFPVFIFRFLPGSMGAPPFSHPGCRGRAMDSS